MATCKRYAGRHNQEFDGEALMDGEDIYGVGFAITAVITFIGCWIYCVAAYGFLLGVGLGWFPSLIVAVIAGALWPLIVLIVIIILAIVI